MKQLKISIYFLLLVVVTLSCEKDTTEFPSNLELENAKIEASKINDASKGPTKLKVCHFDVKNGSWSVIDVNDKTLAKHLDHGDVQLDADGDGHAVLNECGYLNNNGFDCDDTDSTVYPGAPELCDGKDNDCNSLIDDGITKTYYADLDGDTYGDASDAGASLCADPADGRVTNNTDCDDTDISVNPGATEICDNGIDDNCDGQVDEGCLVLAIGALYQGGIIAYILQPGDPGYVANETHGLIAAPSDQSTGAEWGCFLYLTAGANGTAIGTGNQNTLDIVNGCSTAGTAARICNDLVLGAYSDWYLPSIDELTKLYVNRVAIGGVYGASYWSSSQYFESNAWYSIFAVIDNGYTSKLSTFHVRAVRSF